jgi:pyruvate dehydrogenase E1 component alpha subunit
MLAEIWGKKTGICKGMGGSMHVADVSKGILGANGIVGGGFAIATGAAFGSLLSKDGRATICFFGDGAANQGVFMECMNVSSLWKLPIVFVCEHNHFCEFTRAEQVTSGKISDRARAFNIHTQEVDGNDVEAVWNATAEAVERVRRGEGPCFIEAETYRIHGHMEFEKELLAGGKYREAEEIDSWRKKDPIDRYAAKLTQSGAATAAKLEEIGARVAKIVADADKFSHDSEPADDELVFDLMFAGQRP